MKRIFPIVLFSLSLITTGCTSVHPLSDKEEKSKHESNPATTTETIPAKSIVDNKYEFTYLEKLPVDKIEKYNLFLEDGSTNHLTDFTPDQIVLIYMNLVLKHEVRKIYALTYNNGQLPSLDTFSNEYERYLHNDLDEDYLMYRFYDSIGIETKTKDVQVVKLEISYGSTIRGITYALLKEDNVWKMDLYHLIKKAKKEKK